MLLLRAPSALVILFLFGSFCKGLTIHEKEEITAYFNKVVIFYGTVKERTNEKPIPTEEVVLGIGCIQEGEVKLSSFTNTLGGYQFVVDMDLLDRLWGRICNKKREENEVLCDINKSVPYNLSLPKFNVHQSFTLMSGATLLEHHLVLSPIVVFNNHNNNHNNNNSNNSNNNIIYNKNTHNHTVTNFNDTIIDTVASFLTQIPPRKHVRDVSPPVSMAQSIQRKFVFENQIGPNIVFGNNPTPSENENQSDFQQGNDSNPSFSIWSVVFTLTPVFSLFAVNSYFRPSHSHRHTTTYKEQNALWSLEFKDKDGILRFTQGFDVKEGSECQSMLMNEVCDGQFSVVESLLVINRIY